MSANGIIRGFGLVVFLCVFALAGCGDKGGEEQGNGDTETNGAPSGKTAIERDGFYTEMTEGRLWVFRDGSDALKTFKEKGEPAKSVTRIGVGPNGETIRSSDGQTIDAYLSAK